MSRSKSEAPFLSALIDWRRSPAVELASDAMLGSWDRLTGKVLAAHGFDSHHGAGRGRELALITAGILPTLIEELGVARFHDSSDLCLASASSLQALLDRCGTPARVQLEPATLFSSAGRRGVAMEWLMFVDRGDIAHHGSARIALTSIAPDQRSVLADAAAGWLLA